MYPSEPDRPDQALAARCEHGDIDFASDIHEERLLGPGAGGGAIRIGDTVRCLPSRVPDLMIQVLQHLEMQGFDGAPRVLGRDEQDRWVLTYIPGEVAVPPYERWMVQDELLVGVAGLLRKYHEAVATFTPPNGLSWTPQAPQEFRGPFVGHMDVSMSNVVCRDGRPVALIDFEAVDFVQPLWDVVRTVRHWVPLRDPIDLEGELVSLAGRQAERLSLFADSYQLDSDMRARLITAALLSADASYRQMERGAAAGHVGYLREWTGYAVQRNRRGHAWLQAHRSELEGAVRR